MADLRDEEGNRIYLTDQHGKPAQLVDEFGNAMQLKGVATTVPHLKESSYNGPHPITAPITTTNTPHHAQPISVTHNLLEETRADETKPKSSSVATVTTGSVPEPEEKKGLFKKIKEKLSGHHNDP